jgi:enoyl-CoA hydratase/carnithine racemase
VSDIALDLQDGVAVVRFDRPDRLNAFRRQTYAELRGIAARFEHEATWRALVLTGTGRAFCAGQDLNDITGMDTLPAAVADTVAGIQDITRSLARASKPFVCAVNGVAVGFGLEVTLAADLRLAAPAAYFMLPELSHGLFHTNGTYHYLPALVGAGVAADMILTGRRVDAAEALSLGLVSRVVEEPLLLPSAIELARQLTALDPRALALARRGLRERAVGHSLEDALAFEQQACMQLLTQPKGTR